MKQTISISGMTCEACEYKIQHVFSQIPNVKSVTAKHSDNSVTIESDENVSKEIILEVLKPHSKYGLIANPITDFELKNDKLENQSWTNQYYPLFLIAGFITMVSFLTAFHCLALYEPFLVS